MSTSDTRKSSHAAVLLAAFTIGLSGALMPGPLTVVALDHAARGSWALGTVTAFGHGLVEIVMVVGIIFGLHRALQHRAVMTTVALLGGLALIWMGWDMVSSAPAAVLPSGSSGIQEGPGCAGRSLLAGMVATLGNPYWFLWWVTVGASQLAWSREQVPGGMWTFTAGHICSDVLWLSLLSMAAATGRRFLTDSAYRGMLYLMGIIIALIGAYFLYSAHGLRPARGSDDPSVP